MRKTYGYLAHIIIENYIQEVRRREEFWKLSEETEGEEYKFQYQKIGDAHATAADAFLQIIYDQNLTSRQKIRGMELDCINAVRNKEE